MTGFIKCFSAVQLILAVAAAIGQPSISGRVLNDLSGFGIIGIDLDVFDDQGNRVTVTGATSGVDGYYTIELPSDGTFLLRADPSLSDFFVDAYFDQAFLKSQATPILVGPDEAVTGFDIRLQSGFLISGRVESNGVALEGIDIDIYADNGEFLTGKPARTRADGSYTIGALPSGTYFLKADPDPSLDQFFVHSFRGGSLELEGAATVTISGSDVAGIDFELSPGGTISGLISDELGSPLGDIDLDIFDLSGTRLPFNARSDIDGFFEIGPVPEGQYLLRADPTALQGFQRTYYDSAAFSDLASAITVTAGNATSNVDFALITAGSIQGTITSAIDDTPLDNIDIDVFDSIGRRMDITARSEIDGTYLIGPLPPGEYYLRADPALGQGAAHAYYPNELNMNTASLITVAAESVTANIDFSLGPAGSIAGIILDADSGVGLDAIDIDVFDTAGKRVDVTTRSNPDGTYELGPLPVGQFTLRADPSLLQGYARSYYSEAFLIDTATLIDVLANEVTTGIDFSLIPAGWISGTIFDADSSIGIAGIDVDAFDSIGNRYDVTAKSGLDGTYTLGPLPEGQYVLRADPTLAQGFARLYFPGTAFPIDAASIDVVANQGTGGVDFALIKAGSVSGRIVDANSGNGLGAIDLDTFDVSGNRLDVTTKSKADGTYVLGPLPAGSVFLRADPTATQGWQSQFYLGQNDISTAATILVQAGTDTANIDFALQGAGWIEGRIQDASLSAIPEIDIDVFVAATGERVTQGGKSLADGSFIIGPLAPGQYKLRADPSLQQGYAVEYFDGQLNKAFADVITVDADSGTSGVSLTLESGGSMSGVVTSLVTGQPLAGIDIDILQAETLIRLDQSKKTGPEGEFTVGPLPVGDFLLRADPASDQPYLRTYHGDVVDPLAATVVSIAAGESKSNLDISVVSPSVTPSSVILSIRMLDSTTVELSYTTQLGETYALEFTPEIGSVPWQTLSTGTGDGNVATVTDLNTESQRYYRIVTP